MLGATLVRSFPCSSFFVWGSGAVPYAKNREVVRCGNRGGQLDCMPPK
ncbi:hypothetical protein RISK_001434 [Rhodopirellula islandica]|uniref:Uncharacterized protein n=1 Tax=Rhodopirellula islandica TaxID=595434 RepID=A0A0J1BID8_RHOIS|nr:hypothetical protein RISK_001434 [Rhodopirellula islandica]